MNMGAFHMYERPNIKSFMKRRGVAVLIEIMVFAAIVLFQIMGR